MLYLQTPFTNTPTLAPTHTHPHAHTHAHVCTRTCETWWRWSGLRCCVWTRMSTYVAWRVDRLRWWARPTGWQTGLQWPRLQRSAAESNRHWRVNSSHYSTIWNTWILFDNTNTRIMDQWMHGTQWTHLPSTCAATSRHCQGALRSVASLICLICPAVICRYAWYCR